MRNFLALSAVLLGLGAAAAAEPGVKQKIVPPSPLRVSDAERDRIIQTLTASEPALKMLLERFPDARVAVSAAPPEKHRYAVTVSRTFEGYLVQMRVTAAFDDEFSRASEIKRAAFTAIRIAEAKALQPGQVLPPIWISFDRVAEFCADPLQVISTSPVRTASDRFEPPRPN